MLRQTGRPIKLPVSTQGLKLAAIAAGYLTSSGQPKEIARVQSDMARTVVHFHQPITGGVYFDTATECTSDT
jgi:hypothetical protein